MVRARSLALKQWYDWLTCKSAFNMVQLPLWGFLQHQEGPRGHWDTASACASPHGLGAGILAFTLRWQWLSTAGAAPGAGDIIYGNHQVPSFTAKMWPAQLCSSMGCGTGSQTVFHLASRHSPSASLKAVMLPTGSGEGTASTKFQI